MTVKCTDCGETFEDGTLFCDQCGSKLPQPEPVIVTAKPKEAPAATPAQKEREPTMPEKVICPNCRSSSSSASLFCGRCKQMLPASDGTAYAGRYHIEKLIGQGGIGRVYRARRLGDGGPAAIKEMVDDRSWSEKERSTYLAAFRREVELLNHHRVLRTVPALIEQYQDWNGRCFFVMELIEGNNLREILDTYHRPFPVNLVINWATQLCELLHVLHTQEPNSIIHQDLTLDNIIIRKSSISGTDIVLLDLGVARFVRMGTKLSVYSGKVGYAPKEQLIDRRPEPRSDLYSLAVCMHQLLTVQDPAEASSPFPPARQLNSQVPQWLSDLIAINLSEDPRERYESAAKLREDLVNQRVTATIRCPSCGAENERSLIYCTQCAHTLLGTPRKCQHCAEFIPYNARYCPRCGQQA